LGGGGGMKKEAYVNREQAFVKHFVLKNYLQRLAMKVGNFAPGTTVNYTDGFSGPWDAVSPDASDSSPYIAAAELLKAQSILRGQLKPVDFQVRCMFVEKDANAYERLKTLKQSFTTIEVHTFHGEFEQFIDDAVRFAATGPNPFGFTLIDPTGWTGYGLQRITPLLRVRPSEVLINFMTKDIIRFIDDPESSAVQSFQDLFGEASYGETWRGLTGLDREDAIVSRYCERIKTAGRFSHCTSAVILNPNSDRTHYHLVYATRSVEGLVTFRDVERSALDTQRTLRAELRDRKEQEKTGQLRLFQQVPTDSGYQESLAERYEERARQGILADLMSTGTQPYDSVVYKALNNPFVSETVVKQILRRFQEEGRIELMGMKPRQRVPKRKTGVRIRLTRR
jgi:three-Cys-motif partner protein